MKLEVLPMDVNRSGSKDTLFALLTRAHDGQKNDLTIEREKLK
jgi:hypothetical protein